ncbi:MAG: family 1 glycosylhydrolase, partial [Bacteroidia bacterium]|nr:family 1 glycosylhydrolase [Bacteroidia bacterium]
MIRLDFLKYMATLAAMWRANPVFASIEADTEINRKDFGEDFSWGVATSAYQVEGAWNVDGKGESVWDRFSSRGHIKDKSNGNEAIDFYHSYETDLKLLKSLNFKNF